MTDKAIGSVHYIAPEQARGDFTDDKADIYSVGVMLYEMITGQLPFEADNAVSVAIMQLQADPKPPRDINPTIPIGLEEITLKAMQKTPSQRYQSAAEMMQDIEAFRQNPLITFHYQYAQEETATKYVDATTANSTTGPIQYDDDFEYIDDEISSHSKGGKLKSGNKNKVPIIVVSCLAAAIVIALGVGAYFLFSSMGGGGNTSSQSSSDEVDLPNFVGQRLEDIQNNDEYQNFNFTIETRESNDVDEGVVISQSPSGSKKVKANAQITLTVSSGRSPVKITDVSNMTEETAKSTLERLGFQVTVERETSDTVSSGYAIRTSPELGTSAEYGSNVTLYISSGKSQVKVTDVSGWTQASAESTLKNAGFNVQVQEINDDNTAKGLVVRTNPEAGSSLDYGSTVTLYVSKGSANKTANITVTLPAGSNTVSIVAKLDNVIYDTTQQTLSPNQTTSYYVPAITASSGTKTLTITLDGQTYAVYTLDFDKGTWNQTGSYTYVPPQSSTNND